MTNLDNLYILLSNWLLHNFGSMFVMIVSGGQDTQTNERQSRAFPLVMTSSGSQMTSWIPQQNARQWSAFLRTFPLEIRRRSIMKTPGNARQWSAFQRTLPMGVRKNSITTTPQNARQWRAFQWTIKPAKQEMKISRPATMINSDHRNFANERRRHLVAYNRRQCAVQPVSVNLFH